MKENANNNNNNILKNNNRTDYLHKNGFGIKQPTKVDMP